MPKTIEEDMIACSRLHLDGEIDVNVIIHHLSSTAFLIESALICRWLHAVIYTYSASFRVFRDLVLRSIPFCSVPFHEIDLH